ncbi:Glucose 1-dehydrogenase [Coccomyxa sp. Obi]|nr:Glucose 1-dehydrogenase [Coccomyxa sp. Obi]
MAGVLMDKTSVASTGNGVRHGSRSHPTLNPSLKGKRVLITGGSSGIGKATVFAFDANGCSVAVLGRTKERLDVVAKQLKVGVSIVADLTKEEDMKRAVKEALEKLGGLDILVNSGGVSSEEASGNDEAAFLASFRMHVTGNLTLIRAAQEELIKNKGAIVNVTSTLALFPSEGFLTYGVAKAAQDKLTKDLAFEFATKGVRVNSILPAVINTEAYDGVAKANGVTRADIMAGMAPKHAMGRVAEPEEVARPIVFLASNAASFITGASLLVDGGMMLGNWFNKGNFSEASA